MPMMCYKNNKFFFIHIPRTAGRFLVDNLGHHGCKIIHPFIDEPLAFTSPYIRQKIEGVQMLHAHESIYKNWNKVKAIPHFTIVRNPIDRFFSASSIASLDFEQSYIEDWNNFVEWAKNNNHELVIVSAQKPHTKKLTDDWLDFWGFCVKERHYTHKKYSVDIDVLIDDSPTKLIDYKKYSINNGIPICYNQNWNIECRKKMISINRLSEVKKVLL